VIDFDAKNITLPEYELYIRWAQVSAFLPAMQFSISPWQYNSSMEQVCSELIDIHAQTVYPLLEKYGHESVVTGAPIIRPVWWLDNANTDAFDVSDEFLIGDEILVAPIVRQNEYARDVFFPKGKWRSADGSKEYDGPSTIKNYPAPIDTIPYFFRV
jgi:alpha-glucosidase (family GH31 glycosyl hydrolase)